MHISTMQPADFCRALPVLLLLTTPSSGQHHFEEVGGTRGIGAYSMADGFGAGIAAADFDGDGDIDVFVPNGMDVADQLYLNLGNGTFAEVASQVGLDSLANNRAGLWFDYDGDADLDLVVLSDCYSDLPCTQTQLLRLYRMDGGRFTDVTAEAGLWADVDLLEPDGHVGGVCAGDVNGDCYLDLYVCFWEGMSMLFLNDTQGGFVDVSVSSGIRAYKPFWQCVMHDFNGDGWLDIFQAVDFLPNLLWINQGHGIFVDMASEAGVDSAFNEMGVALGDYDNDGDFDVYVTNLYSGPEHNVLFRNFSNADTLQFVEVAEATGVSNGYCGWGTTFLDGDHGGWLDIAATNGGGSLLCVNDPSRYFQNQGGANPVFADASTAVQYADTEKGSGLVAFDADRDGDLELMQACMNGPLLFYDHVLDGPAASQRFLVIRPRMDGPNHFAIGAVVRVSVQSQTLSRLITAGTSFLSQEPAEAHFGVLDAELVDVTIEWPDGLTTTYEDVPTNRTLTVSRSMAISDCIAAPNSVGSGAHMGFLGTTSVGANDFVLTAAGAPPIEFGLFYYGPEAAQVPFGDGLRCVGPGELGLFRLQPPLATDAAGALARTLELSNPPEPAGTIGMGSTWSFQFWYRDPAAGGTGFNLSDALRSTFCP